MKAKYFVLKPKGSDMYAEVSRTAMLAYALVIADINNKLAQELVDWAEQEKKLA